MCLGAVRIPTEQMTPILPPGRLMVLPGRGTTFVRVMQGPAGSLPVMLLHGWTLTADLNFHAVYDVLSREHTVIALDCRSHGRGIRAPGGFRVQDSVDDAIAVLDQLDVPQAIICGYSLGGVTAIATALRHPDRVAAVVPQACALRYKSGRREVAVFHLLRILRPLARLGIGATLSARMWVDTAQRNPHVAAQWLWLREELALMNPYDMTDVLTDVFRQDLAAELAAGGLDVPAAFVVLNRDRLCRPSLQRRAAEAINARTFTIDADHDVPVCQPDIYAAVTAQAVAHARSLASRKSGPSLGA
jgi:pimeloyl-ACP methyl ester carboxylesterase